MLLVSPGRRGARACAFLDVSFPSYRQKSFARNNRGDRLNPCDCCFTAVDLRDCCGLGLRDKKVSVLWKQEPVGYQSGRGGTDFLYIDSMSGITLFERRPRVIGRDTLGLGAEEREEPSRSHESPSLKPAFRTFHPV